MVAIGITLLITITVLKLNTFVSLIILSFVDALTPGTPLENIVTSIEGELGAALIALIIGQGEMSDRLIADTSGVCGIALTLINQATSSCLLLRARKNGKRYG